MGGFFKRTGNGRRDFGKANLIIFLFALAHAFLCYLLHDTSVGGRPLSHHSHDCNGVLSYTFLR
jgi:hypothetical protein